MIRVGIGGWTFEPWRGTFYPEGLPHKRELEFASRALTSIEINGTYYSTFKPDSWRKWHDETPDDFVFAVKASRYCTNRKVLADAGESIDRFLNQGLSELGPKLGPINWQFMATKKFDPEDFGAFLALLPHDLAGRPLRHAIEARHESFAVPSCYELARTHKVAIVTALDDTFPQIDEPTAEFKYARVMATTHDAEVGRSSDDATGLTPARLKSVVNQVRTWAKRGDVFVYFISAAKVHNPQAALAVLRKLA